MVSKIGAPDTGRTAVPSAQVESDSTTVQKGENAYSLAKRLGVALEELLAANPGMKTGDIKPGKEVKVPAATAGEAEVPAAASGPSTEGAAAKKGEVAIKEQAKAKELQSEVDLESKPLTAADPKKVLKSGSKGAEVKELQQQLNEARKAYGEAPIPETGVYDAATKAAVAEFQDNDGQIAEKGGNAGPVTRDNLALANDPNFQNLEASGQASVKGLLGSWKDNPAARANIMAVGTDPSFGKLNEKQQEAVLAKLSQNPETANIGALKQGMKEFAALKDDENFKKLDPKIQDNFTRAFFAISPKTPQAREDLGGILKDPNFGKLSPDIQEKVGQAFFSNSGDAAFTKSMKELAGSGAFAGLKKEEQENILKSLEANPDAKYAAALAGNAASGKLSGTEGALKDIRDGLGLKETPATPEGAEAPGSDPLAGLSVYTRGQVDGLMDSWKSNPAAKENLSKIAADPAFQKLADEEQQLVLRKLMQNPGTKHVDQLVAAVKEFTDIKADPDFQALSPGMKDDVTRGFFYIGLNAGHLRSDYASLVKDGGFAKLPEDVIGSGLQAFYENPNDPDYTKNLKDMLGSKQFLGLPKEDQLRLIGTIANNADTRFVTEMARLGRMGLLDNLDEDGVNSLLGELGLAK